ncbi:MAG: sensor histidine kinase, partial [Gaiellaceae bacterium]
MAEDEPSRAEPTEEILAAEQDERRRIALFLHDGPVQSLAGVALMLDAALNFLQRGDTKESGEVLDRALSRTRTTIGELRNLSFNLEPVVLRDHGIGTALQALGDDRGAANGISVEVDAAAAETLSERTQAALY